MQFCKVVTKCRARAEEKLKFAEVEFKMPPLLSEAEIESMLAKIPDMSITLHNVPK